MSQHKVILLLGSNLGDKIKNINKAISLLEAYGCIVLKKTKILKTKPLEFVSYNIFCNIALSIETFFSPIELLDIVKRIEFEIGREYDSSYFGEYRDRLIDVDIVFYENLRFISKRLNIPHQKNAFERDFSLELIKEIMV